MVLSASSLRPQRITPSSISIDLQMNSSDDAKAEFNYLLIVPINRRLLYLAYEPFRSGQTKQPAMYVVLIKHVCVERSFTELTLLQVAFDS